MSKNVTFIVDTDGDVKISTVEGYGAECLEATKLLERRLGSALEETRKFTDELFEGTVSTNENSIEL
jgi:hypothetical protein